MLFKYLQGYDEEEKNYVVSGFKQGFTVSCDEFQTNLTCHNLPSALARPEIVSDKIAKELLGVRIAGPFYDHLFQNFHISPLGLCPKKDPNKFRMIHHLSYPKGLSVNDFIPPEFTSVQYTKVQDVIMGIKQFLNIPAILRSVILKWHTEIYPFVRLTIICLVLSGKIYSIMINAWQWGAHLHAKSLNDLALL